MTLEDMIVKRYAPPSWILLWEVGNATAGFQTRRADAIAMTPYPSRGLEIHGIEVKTSRTDWQRELKDPAKSAPIQKYCDFWWIVAPEGVVQDGELPSTWGLLMPQGSALRIKSRAPRLNPEPISRGFLASILRSVSQAYAYRPNLRKEYEAEFQRGVESQGYEVKRLKDVIENQKHVIEKAKNAAGKPIQEWDLERVGHLLDDLKRLRSIQEWNGLGNLAGRMRAAAESLETIEEELKGEAER